MARSPNLDRETNPGRGSRGRTRHGGGFLERLAEPNGDLAREWDRDHDKYVVEKLLAVVETDLTPTTREAFQRFGVDGVPAGRVAEELGLTENAVILAKSRILRDYRNVTGRLGLGPRN